MGHGDEAQIRAFLAQTLALWRVDGSVETMVPPGVALIRARNGRVIVQVERAAPDSPFRWTVLSLDRLDDPKAALRARPCPSLVGVLSAMRRALGIERGRSMRVAPDHS